MTHALLGALFVFVISMGGMARAQEAPDDPELGQRLGEVVDGATLGQFWGTVVVRVGGRDVLRRGYGLEGPSLEPIDPGVSLFDVGSVSKSLTGATVLAMVEDGDLSLETTLGEVFVGEDLGVFGDTTIDELLGHRWGLRDPGAAMRGADFSRREAMTDVLRFAVRDGERGSFAYSNFGYFVLGSVIEVRSGVPFEDAVRARVIEGAGLLACGFVGDGSIPGGRATLRVSAPWSGSGRGRASSDVFGYPWNWGQRGATGVVMTGDDAARWIEAVVGDGTGVGNELLGEASRGAMLLPGAGGYGLGVYVSSEGDGVSRVWHGGATGGYRCVVSHYPEGADGEGVTIVVLTNERWQAEDIERRLARVVVPPEPRASRAGVYLFKYEPVDGVVEIEGGLSWSVMPSYRGRGADGVAIVEDRPTIVTVDAGASMWNTMVMLDPAEALALAEGAERAAEQVGRGPGMSMRVDVAGLTLSETKHVQLSPGSVWTIGVEDGTIVARLTDKETGGAHAVVRMGTDEARDLAAALREASR